MMSMAGEGRGHATRALALVEALRGRHQIELFAPGDAYAMLGPRYAQTDVELHWIPGINNRYDARRNLDLLHTAKNAAVYFARLPRLVGRLRRAIEARRPHLVISDFEPSLPRAAHASGVPHMTVDHQHFLVVNDLSTLPPKLRFHASLMAPVVRALYGPAPRSRVVSSFYQPPLKSGFDNVVQVGVFLRPQVLAARPEAGDGLVVYLRRFAPPQLLRALERAGRPVVVYGLGEQPARGRVRFRAIDDDRFVSDLARSAGLVTTAGNQIVGEALHLGKPVLAMPESNNFEQCINAHFLERSGAGLGIPLERCSERHIRDFVDRLCDFRRMTPSERSNGTTEAVEEIERQLASLGASSHWPLERAS